MPMSQEEREKLMPFFEELNRRLKEIYEKEAPFIRKLFDERFPNGVKINQYDADDNLVSQYNNFDQLLQCENYKKYYYRYNVYSQSSREISSIKHFGVKIKVQGSAKLMEEYFLNAWLNREISSDSLPKYIKDPDMDPFPKPLFYRLINKLEWIKRIDRLEFEKALNLFLKKWPLTEISDLFDIAGSCGIYFMVLDEYKQCYIGKAKNLKQRVMQHWTREKDASGTNVNTFRACDTTRIFAISVDEKAYANLINRLEEAMIRSIDEMFLLNIMPGGSTIGNIHDPNSTIIRVDEK